MQINPQLRYESLDAPIGNERFKIAQLHPIQQMQECVNHLKEQEYMKQQSITFGSALPMIQTLERNNCSQIKRGFGKKSKLLHLNIIMDNMDEVDFHDIFQGEPIAYKNPHYANNAELL